MALQFPFKDVYGVSHPAAYGRVTLIEFSPGGGYAEISLSIYAGAQARRDNWAALQVEKRVVRLVHPLFTVAALDAQGMNLSKASYLYMRSLSEYNNAVDV